MSKKLDMYVLDPLAPFNASRMPGKKKGGVKYHTPGSSNFLKHKGGESRHFDYEICAYLGKTKTWEDWVEVGTKAVESYPNYGKRGGKSASISATRMLYGMRKEGLLIKA